MLLLVQEPKNEELYISKLLDLSKFVMVFFTSPVPFCCAFLQDLNPLPTIFLAQISSQ